MENLAAFGEPILAGDKPILIVEWGDTHPNSTLGLCPPKGIQLDEGGWYLPSAAQAAIWKAYLDFLGRAWRLKKQLGAFTFGLFGGDGSDDNIHGKTQLATLNEAVIVDTGVAVMEPALDIVDALAYLRGTEAHVHRSGALEEMVAKRLAGMVEGIPGPRVIQDKLGRYSHWVLKRTFHGLRGVFAHHAPTTATRPWTVPGGAARTAAMLVDDYADARQQPPDFGVFFHCHHYEYSGDTRRTRVWFAPPWQICTAHGHRRGYGARMSPVGGILLLITPNGKLTHERVLYWPKEDEWLAA